MQRWLAILLVVLMPTSILAQEGKDIKGVVQDIDSATGVIRIILLDAPKATRIRTFNLLKRDLPVIDETGKLLKLTDVQPDQHVVLKILNEDVTAVRLTPPTVFGILMKVDAKERTVVLATKIGDKSYYVPPTAKIIEQKMPSQFENLKPGLPTLISLTQDHKTVLEVKAGKSVAAVARLVKELGHLIDIDRGKHTVKILGNTTAGDIGLVRELTFSKDASFALLYKTKLHRALTIEEVAQGARVYYWTDYYTGKVTHLEIEMPVLAKRLVKAFDRAQGLLTLQDVESDITLPLTPQTRVLTEKAPAKREDIQLHKIVQCGLSPDRKSVELIVISAK